VKRFKHAGLVAVAVCGIFATTAVSASAHEWEIKGSTLKSLGLESQPFASSGGKFEFDWFVFGEHQKWICSTESGSGKLLPEGKLTETIKYSGCGFTAGVFGAEGCKISTPVESQVSGELVEVGKEAYVRYSGAKTKTLIVVLTGCMSEGIWGFSGSFSALAKPFGEQVVEQPRTFSAAIDEKVGTAIAPAGSPSNIVRITGSTKDSLTGANAGVIWGAVI
jgi:hypothetical protein